MSEHPGLPMTGKWLPIVFSPPMEPLDTRTMFVRPAITEGMVYVETGLRSEGRALMLYEFTRQP